MFHIVLPQGQKPVTVVCIFVLMLLYISHKCLKKNPISLYFEVFAGPDSVCKCSTGTVHDCVGEESKPHSGHFDAL